MRQCPRCSQPRQVAKGQSYCRDHAAAYQRDRYVRVPRKNSGRPKHPAYRMFNSAKDRAKRNGLEFTIKLRDLVVPDICPVLGIPLDKRDLQHTPSLDRFDSSKGYTKENVRIISFRANSIKQDATFEEIVAVMEYMRP